MGVYVYQNEQLDKVAGLGYNVVDTTMSSSSENPVQNKVIKEYVDTKVSKDQGVEQSGKVLGINVNGMVTPVDVAGSASDITYDNSTSGLTATNAQDAIDEVDSTVDGLGSQVSTLISDTANYYNITDSTDTTLDDADSIPFYDTSASAKKKIIWTNIVTKIKSSLENYFGRKFSQSNGKLSLLSDNNTVLDTVTLSPLATNTSYTDTNKIGATNVQSAVDFFGTYSDGQATLNTSYLSGAIYWQKIGKMVSVYYDFQTVAQLPNTNWELVLVTNLPPIRVFSMALRRFAAIPISNTGYPLVFGATNNGPENYTVLFSWGNGAISAGNGYRGNFEYFTF